ncbi:hypothetical protein [Sulfurimonas marina]|uniref:Uncharacterized protein n=1 Tax=Sulfurimonas marina TaxID=2590551 RepID=A0A7M3V9N5_9BACT|nr:hypothetical protein [Sulfurimonas marina]QOP40468.1 hypothetical protein FJR03_01415 [Sulfurimonas marina]
MRKLFLLVLLSTLLFSKNPDVYAALGDVIYNNVDNISKLKDINQFSVYKDKIEKYTQKVNATKAFGFKIEQGEPNFDKKTYLSSLRALSRDNDFFLRLAKKFYEDSITTENSQLFSEIINSGLINTDEHKQEIIDYYFAHQEDINASGVIQAFLDADAGLRGKKETELKNIKSKRERELERIKQIREKDKREQEALEQKLQKELEAKKKEVREEQKRELLKTR